MILCPATTFEKKRMRDKIKRMCKKINDLMPLKKLVVDFLKSSEKQMNI